MAVRPLAPAFLVMTLALAGCAGGGSDDAGGNASPTTSPAPSATSSSAASSSTAPTSASPPASPQTVQKDIRDNSFPDGTFSIRAGDTVVWTHRGSAPHSVTSDGSFDSHPNCTFATSAVSCMQGGQTYSHAFDAAGSFPYRCRIHGSMTGTITVTE